MKPHTTMCFGDIKVEMFSVPVSFLGAMCFLELELV